MFNHVMVGSNDIERSKTFYDAVMATLGAGAAVRNEAPTGHARLFYRHAGSSFCVSEPIDGNRACPANGATIGFSCYSPAQVHDFHASAIAHGGCSIEEPPGPRGSGAALMHLAYVRDPDGHKLCAIYRPAR